MASQNPLDFTGFKRKLQEYIKANTEFRDINYEGSGINQLLNILSYTGVYLGYYLEANDNEHYLQTAQLRSSLSAGAKRNGYVVRGKKASRAEVMIETTVDDIPANKYIHISRELNVLGTNELTDVNRDFLFEKDVYLYDYERTTDNKFRFFTTEPKTLVQGERKVWRFQYSGDRGQRFLIKDPDMDIDTLRVFVKNTLDETEIGEEFILSHNIVKDYGKDNAVFNIVTAEEGWYEIFFGNNIISRTPKVDQYIVCEYMSPAGVSGDGCTSFRLGGFQLTTVASSFGGSDGESNEAIRYNAQYYFRRQNRLFTVSDIKSILLQEFRNIKSINVWGGEDNVPKLYGKTIVAIKPNNAEALSAGAKLDIKKRMLDEYGYLGMDIQLVDPEYINVDMVFTVVISDNVSDITRFNTEEEVKKAVHEYSEKQLNQFGNYLNDLELNSFIKKSVGSVDSVYSKKMMAKTVPVNTNNTSSYTVTFVNPIVEGSVHSVFSDYNYKWTMVDDQKGNLLVSTVTNLGEKIEKTIGTVDYSNGTFIFNLPLVSGRDYPYFIDIGAEAVKPNIYSKHLNVVRIREIVVRDVLKERDRD